jgi:hypothetical protein
MIRMYRMSQEAIAKLAQIVAGAARLPLYDVAFALWRQVRGRLFRIMP